MDELIQAMNAAGVRYLLVGGQAMRLYGMPRFTMDWDFFLPPRDEQNLRRLNDLLNEELREPVVALGPAGENFVQTFQTRWGVLQFHLGLPGAGDFDDAYGAAVCKRTEANTPVHCLSAQDLLRTKLAANRPQDQLDIEYLRELQRHEKL